jgi:hypothetical protein
MDLLVLCGVLLASQITFACAVGYTLKKLGVIE